MELNRAVGGFEDGVIATLAMSVPMVLATVTGKSPVPEPFPKAIVERIVGRDAPEPVVGLLTMASHLFYGGSNGAAVAALGNPVSVRTGLGWGVGLWGLMQVAFMPFVGWGLFGRKLSESRMAAVATLALHLVYGGTLGWLLERDAGEGPPVQADGEETESRTLVEVNIQG